MLINEMDVRTLDARAVAGSVDVVSLVAETDLARPTPCAEWTLADLLAHMTTQHRGFAAAAAGNGADPAAWEVRPLGSDAVPAYAAAADEVVTAFAAEGVLERKFQLPEISTTVAIPAGQAISFHFIDYVVHGWDVARSLGVKYEPAADLLDAALVVAQAVPDGPERLAPGAAFLPGLPESDGDPVLHRILAMLGRSPNWPN